MNAWEFVTGQPWAIQPDALTAVLAIAKGDGGPIVDRMIRIAEQTGTDIEAVQMRAGKPLDNTRKVTVRDGVAVIPVRGVIGRYANLFSAISGGTSIQVLATDFQAALDNPDVKAIVLEIDSPGGTVAGTQEFAQAVYDARRKKPVYAYVSSLGASAGYWIASAAEKMVVAPTAMLGSIGVVTTVPTGGDDGSVEFVSSQSPGKRMDPRSRKGMDACQAKVDALASIFIGDVARNRGVSEDTVVKDFGGGDVLIGQAAVDAGMADAVGTFESTLSHLSRDAESDSPTKTEPARPAATHQGKSSMTVLERIGSYFARKDPAAFAEAAASIADAPEVAAETTNTASNGQASSVPTVRVLADGSIMDAAGRVFVPKEEVAAVASARKLLSAGFRKNAEAFVSAALKDGKALPGEKDSTIALFVAHALADVESPVTAEVDGQTVTYSRLDHFTAAIDKRPSHGLTSEVIAGDEGSVPESLKQFKILPEARTPEDKKAAKAKKHKAEMLEAVGIDAE